MRKRVMFFTSIIVVSSLLLSTQVEALSEPTRESAQIALYTAPVSLRVDTSAKKLLSVPKQSTLELPFSQRDIFAPLTTKPVVLQGRETKNTAQKQTLVAKPQEPLRLSAMIKEIVYQEVEVPYTAGQKEYYEGLLARAFSKMPEKYVQQLKRLTLKNSRTGSRGLGGAAVMILRTAGVPENDFVAVAIHELGHIIDMGAVDGNASFAASAFMDGSTPVWSNDRSLAFYRISWISDTEMKSNAMELDFVSGYAMSDPFEDFAESFAMYVLHGERFAQLAQENEALAQKYAYIRDEILDGREFRGIDLIPASTPTNVRPYDTTIQPYNKFAFDATPAW